MSENHLAKEKSLYLKQHAENPVHWYSWGSDAFLEATRQNRPVLVSIGYSACHWCHVMERESFESNEVARVLNQYFICIKVDREENPHVDAFYMQALLNFSGRGGWPLNMFCLPDQRPFWGGTYFPQQTFLEVLNQIQGVWIHENEKVFQHAEALTHQVIKNQVLNIQVAPSSIEDLRTRYSQNYLPQLVKDSLSTWDSVQGGFGRAPKFPRSHQYNALMRALSESSESENPQLPLMIQNSLWHMFRGGMWDHLGGGFHRYSTDAQWLVPHFEKMLYDQSLLLQTYSEAYKIWGHEMYRHVCQEIFEYVERELLLPQGTWAAAQDADSEGVEGKYFVWKKQEIVETLKLQNFNTEEIEQFCKIHSVSEEGNWEEKTILSLLSDEYWTEYIHARMSKAREVLMQYRQKRIAPQRDTKCITSWNAHWVSAQLRASWNLQSEDKDLSLKLREAALRGLKALVEMAGTELNFPHVSYGGYSHIPGLFEDYAALLDACVWAYISDENPSQNWLALSQQVIEYVQMHFRDETGKLISYSGAQKFFQGLEGQDGATPAALSVWVGALLRYSLSTQNSICRDWALQDLAPLKTILERAPVALTYLLTELECLRAPQLKYRGVFRSEWGNAFAKPVGLWLPLRQEGAGLLLELCDFYQCYWAGDDLREGLQILSQHQA